MTVSEAFGRTIQLFLVDGAPTGPHKVRYHDWQQGHITKEEARRG
jgi:hypothetical protein